MGIMDTIMGFGKLASFFTGNDDKGSVSQSGSSDSSESSIAFGLNDELSELLGLSNSQTTQSGSSTEKGTATSDTSGSSTENVSGKENTSQGSTSAGTENQSSTTSAFSDELMGSLNDLLSGTLSNSGIEQGQQVVSDRLSQISGNDFDVENFVSGIMQSANSNAKMDLERGVNNNASQIGGSQTGNSMAALLGQRLKDDTAANLAGVEAQATAQGYQIRGQETAELSSLAQAGSGSVLDLIQTMMGAQSTTTGQVQSTLQEKSDKVSSSSTAAVGTNTGKETQTTNSSGTSQSNSETNDTTSQTSSTMGNQLNVANADSLTNTDSSGTSKETNGGNVLDNIFNAFSESQLKA